MSIQRVIIPVPVSGQGPVANVSALAGQKTVVLTGRFRGYYDLLGSQDDINFVGVASFSAGGVESIKQTVAGAFKSFRLLSHATPVGAPVTCEVSGVVGQNYFTTLASFPVGSGGTSAAVDTWALFPPTGVEQDMCFLCTGGFRGSIVVLGSLDGAEYNAVGSFTVDRLPEGSPETLTFPALLSQDKVRYLKVQVAGTITSAVTVTFGGSIPASVGPVTGDNISIISDINGNPHYFTGTATLDSPLADANGNIVVLPTHACAVEGASNQVGTNSTNMVVHGSSNVVGDDVTGCFVGGNNNQVGSSSATIVMVGTTNNAVSSANLVVMGLSNQVGAGASAVIELGIANNAGAGSSTINLQGTANRVGTNGTSVLARGLANNVGNNASAVIADGRQHTVGNSCGPVVCTGSNDVVGDNCTYVFVFGSEHTVITNTSHCLVAGDRSVVVASTSCQVLGNQHQVGANSTNTIVVGTQCNAGSSSNKAILFGNSIVLANASASSEATIIGSSHTINGTAPGLVAIGTVINCSQDWSAGTNNRDHACVIIGFGGNINSNAIFTRAVLVGVPTVGGGGDLGLIIDVGDSTILHGTSLNGKLVVVGFTNTSTGQSSSVYGNDNTLSDGNQFVHVRGNNNTVGASTTYTQVSGSGNTVGHDVVGCHVAGTTNHVGDSCNRVILVGVDNTAGISTVESLVLGNDNVLNTGADRAVVSGWHINVLSGDPGHAAAFCVASGSQIQVGLLSQDTVAVGHTIAVGARTVSAYALGQDLTVGDDCTGIVLVGINMTVGNSVSDINSVGRNNDLSLCAGTTNVVGNYNTFEANCQGHVLGNACAFQSLPEGNTYGIAIGTGITILSTGQNWAIGIGDHVTAGPRQCIIGDSDDTIDPRPFIDYFAVRGYNGAALDTIRAVDSPADGETGLTVVFNTAGTFSNKTLKASATPPVGSLYVYLDP